MKKLAPLLASLLTFGALVPAADASTAPANDTAAGATVIGSLPFEDAVDMTYATPDEDGTATCYSSDAASVWYRMTPTAQMVVDMSTAGSGFDTTLDVYDSNSGDHISCNDDARDHTSALRVRMAAGTSYLVRVSGYSSDDTGLLQFAATEHIPPPPPANDTRAAAMAVNQLPFDHTADARSATADTDDAWSCFWSDSPSVWYRFTPTRDMIIDVTSSDWYAQVDIFEGDNNLGCAEGYRLRTTVSAGHDYFIRLATSDYEPGDLNIKIVEHIPLQASVSVAETATVTPGGAAVVQMTVTCNKEAEGLIELVARQAVGPVVTRDGAVADVACGERVTVPVRFTPEGAFLPGLAEVTWEGWLCDRDDWEDCVNLRGSRNVLLIPGV